MPPRFFVAHSLTPGQTVALEEGNAHHALRVLRLESGELVELFNGDGRAYSGEIKVDGKKASVTIAPQALAKSEASTTAGTNRPKLRLVQGLCTSEKLDWLIEKVVELGVDELCLVQMQRSKMTLDADRSEKKLLRWRDLIIAACTQSRRNTIPQLNFYKSLDAFFGVTNPTGEDLPKSSLKLICCPPVGNEQSASLYERLKQLTPSTANITIIVGPESGFSEAEQKQSFSLGYQPTGLGPLILRTETAGIISVALAAAVI
jgi:16S rRNA (uracil1498-N3)-methyltransferase